MTDPVRRLAVVGQPISHSRSPAMQTAALRELGLDRAWSYEAIEISPEDFEERIREMALSDFAGVNVTIPHKEAALGLADEASDAAHEIGAANTLSFVGGRILAENTDAPGLIASLPGSVEGTRALLLGAGGAGRAAAWALKRSGARVEVWNRTAERAERLVEEMELAAAVTDPDLARYQVVVNATAIGLHDPNERNASFTRSGPDSSSVPLPVDQFNERHVFVDLVYGDHPTYLVKQARERGAKVVDGIEMLVNQGAASLRIWTGIEPPLGVMRRAARSDLD